MDENRQNAICTTLVSRDEFGIDCNQIVETKKRFSAVRYDNDIWMIGGELSGSSSVF